MENGRHSAACSFGLLILRAGIGGFMMSHGWGKLQMMMAGEWDKFGNVMGLGSKPGLILAVLAEFVAAAMVVIGLGTRLAAAGPAFAMGVAAFVVHRADPLSMETAAKAFMAGTSKSWSSKEPALLYMIPFLALIFTGAGRFSIDGLIFGRRGARATEPAVRPLAR